jgi:peptidoglycan/LPS O-acetylase OafA/YrhL
MKDSVSALPHIADDAQHAGRGPTRSLPDQRVGSAPPHIPSLDGLRAASLSIVFVSHAGLQWIIPGGFGVTVFFFLSGYLITTLMRFEQQTTGAVSVRDFYMRRALRILPPFYLVLALATTLAFLRVLPGDLQFRVVLAQALHVANYWYIWFGSDGSAAGTVPYWSLAVEEHFYLVFPFLYIGLSRLLSNRAQARTFWALCAIVCAWRCVLVLVLGVTENRTFMASDTRVDSILFGCALAVGMNPVLDSPWGSERLWKSVLLPAGLLLLTFTFVYRAPWFRETLRYTVQGIALTPLFVSAIRFPKWLPFRALNARPVAYIGVLSYTLYLVHQVALVLVAYQLPALDPLRIAILALLLSFIVALTLHRLVEKPCARIRKRLTRVAPTVRRDPTGQTALPHALTP